MRTCVRNDIDCQRQLDQLGGYLNQKHEEYERQHDLWYNLSVWIPDACYIFAADQLKCAEIERFLGMVVELRLQERLQLTSTPRFSRSLMTGFFADGIWLSLVLRHSSVNAPVDIVSFSPRRSVGIGVILNNVRSDGRLEHRWKRVSLSTGITRCGSNRNGRASRHIGGCVLRRETLWFV